MQIRDALKQAARNLQRAGADSPRLDAELLLAHVLELTRASLLAHPDRPLTVEQFSAYRRLVERRAKREPLAYIVGHREFFGLEFAVDPRVLVPRPETELLVERALSILRPLSAPLMADVGAGSGAIAVSLAVRLPGATIYALDSSAEALAVAAERQAVTDVDKAYQSYLAARQTLLLYSRENIGQVQKLQELAEFTFRQGDSSLFELLETQRNTRQTLIAYNQARGAYQLALWQLEAAVGAPIS